VGGPFPPAGSACEPFAALDFQTRLTMQELLLRLWHEIHPKIFFITHDVEEAIFLADRVYVMSEAPGRSRKCSMSPSPSRGRSTL
jgi:NitT/TauT family transport system ATP-binding protein